MEGILGSSVIAAIVASAISLVLARRQNKLQYITTERKEWRAQIRDISEKLQVCKDNEINEILSQLKVRINAYGKNCSVIKSKRIIS